MIQGLLVAEPMDGHELLRWMLARRRLTGTLRRNWRRKGYSERRTAGNARRGTAKRAVGST